jgi:hypothetical protein
MPTKKQLSQMMESQFEYPSTRREDDPMYVPPSRLKEFNDSHKDSSSEQTAQVSDTTNDDSSNAVK